MCQRLETYDSDPELTKDRFFRYIENRLTISMTKDIQENNGEAVHLAFDTNNSNIRYFDIIIK